LLAPTTGTETPRGCGFALVATHSLARSNPKRMRFLVSRVRFGFARDRIGRGYSAGVGISARISTVGREKKAKGVRVCVREGGSVGERY